MSRERMSGRSWKRGMGCGSKRRYRDHAQAVEALHHLLQCSRREKLPIRVYACDVCSGWHMTSMPRVVVAGEEGGV